jgi:hypothetical protein
MKTRDLFKEFSKHEDSLIRRYSAHPLFTKIQSLSDERFLSVLTQYGEGISANFVKFLETALRQIENKSAQRAILQILRDEIPSRGPTHQQMRTNSCARIGITPLQLVSTKLSDVTKLTLETYYEVITNPERRWHNRDLALTTFVRVVGESLVGVVYKVFTQEIIRRFGVTEGEIEFYSFHWHHDEKGGKPVEGSQVGHTEYYDIAMKDLLKTEEDLEEAKKVGEMALEIRSRFQDQF